MKKLPSEGDGTSGGRQNTIEKSQKAPFPFVYLETKLREKNFGILTTITPEGLPHSVGVVYGMPPGDQPFILYLITRPVLKKARNISKNPNISFVVPFPHYWFRLLPQACIQFQATAEIIPFDDQVATKAFQSSIVLRRSYEHSTKLGESIFIRVVPAKKIYSFGIGANTWQFLVRSQYRKLGNFYVEVPESRRQIRN